MKKFLLISISIILSFNGLSLAVSPLKCGSSIITVDKKYIYQNFASGDIDKYKITNRGQGYVSGFLKGKNINYDVFLDIDEKSLTVNKKDRKTGIIGSYTKNCS